MGVSHARSLTKPSGGKKKKYYRKRKKAWIGREPAKTTVGETKIKKVRVRGGNYKFKALRIEYANVLDPKTGKSQKVKILNVKDNPANRNFARMNIITKGAIIITEIGEAKVTSRPGQEGIVNAVLL